MQVRDGWQVREMGGKVMDVGGKVREMGGKVREMGGKVSVPRVQVKRRPSATGLLLRTHSAGPVSQTCLLTTSKARAATRLRNPR
jgi:hypothetical protein